MTISPPPLVLYLHLNRIRFLLECLHDLNKQLHRYGTSLYVVKGHPLASLERICGKWNVNRLVFQEDRDIRSDIVESVVERLAASLNIEVKKIICNCMWQSQVENKH